MSANALPTPDSSTTQANGTVRVDRFGAIAHVVFNRPDSLNSLTPEMFHDITMAGLALAEDDTVNAVVMRGEGRAFCAGLDMSQFERIMAGGVPGEPVDMPSAAKALGQQAVEVWSHVPVPVIAAIHGPALGGGLQFALGADIRISTPDAKLAAMEVAWGIIPDMMGTQLLPKVVGPSQAKRLIFTAETITGERALELGLVDELTDDPLMVAHQLAEELADKSRSALVWSKKLVDMVGVASLEEGLAAEQVALRELQGTDEQKLAVQKRMEQLAARKAAKG